MIFRIFFWWGKNVIMDLFKSDLKKAGIVRISETNNMFPVSFWCRSEERVYCITFLPGESDMDIIKMPSLSNN